MKSNYIAAVSGAQLTEQTLIKHLSQAFTAPEFTALVSVDGIDANSGNPFHTDFIFDQTDPEFISFLNDYAARKMGERMFSEWLPVTDSQPADNIVVTIPYHSGPVYRNGGRWYNAKMEREIKISPETYRVTKPARS